MGEGRKERQGEEEEQEPQQGTEEQEQGQKRPLLKRGKCRGVHWEPGWCEKISPRIFGQEKPIFLVSCDVKSYCGQTPSVWMKRVFVCCTCCFKLRTFPCFAEIVLQASSEATLYFHLQTNQLEITINTFSVK